MFLSFNKLNLIERLTLLKLKELLIQFPECKQYICEYKQKPSSKITINRANNRIYKIIELTWSHLICNKKYSNVYDKLALILDELTVDIDMCYKAYAFKYVFNPDSPIYETYLWAIKEELGYNSTSEIIEQCENEGYRYTVFQAFSWHTTAEGTFFWRKIDSYFEKLTPITEELIEDLLTKTED